MTTHRTSHKENFTVIDNGYVRDDTISDKARGVLTRMLSMPDDWTFYETNLVKGSTGSIGTLRSALKELTEHGYLIRKRVKDTTGHFGAVQWDIYETPLPKTENSTGNNYRGKNYRGNNSQLPSTNNTKDLYNQVLTTPSSSLDSENYIYSDTLKQISDCWQAGGLVITPKNLEGLGKWLDHFQDKGITEQDAADLILRAIENMKSAGSVRSPYNYVNSILTRYDNENYRNIADIEAADNARRTNYQPAAGGTSTNSDSAMDRLLRQIAENVKNLTAYFKDKGREITAYERALLEIYTVDPQKLITRYEKDPTEYLRQIEAKKYEF